MQRQIEQLELKLEDLEANRAAKEQQQEHKLPASVATVPTSTNKPTRGPLPGHLPRETKIHVPDPQTCPECGGQLRKLGEDVSEILEYVPARFRVIRHVRPEAELQRL